MLKIIYLLAGGALGSLSRYLVSGWVHGLVSGTFPWGTLLVNTSGSFVIGLLWGMFEMRDMAPHIRTFAFIGFLGGYTTFSSYALETMNLVRDGDVGMAAMNIVMNNLLALVFVFAGYFLSRALLTTLSH